MRLFRRDGPPSPRDPAPEGSEGSDPAPSQTEIRQNRRTDVSQQHRSVVPLKPALRLCLQEDLRLSPEAFFFKEPQRRCYGDESERLPELRVFSALAEVFSPHEHLFVSLQAFSPPDFPVAALFRRFPRSFLYSPTLNIKVIDRSV